MNNKGMTLVELIITFALVLVIVVGLYNLIIDVKFQMEDVQEAKDLTEYSSTINNDIHYQLLRNSSSIKKVYIEGDKCYSVNGISCESSDVTKFQKDCKDISKCIVYQYSQGEKDYNVVIALNDDDNVLSNYGILYGEGDSAVFEALPIDKKYIMLQTGLDVCSEDKEKCLYVSYDDGNLIINYPLYLKDDTDYSHNYGFKIVAPIGFDTK